MRVEPSFTSVPRSEEVPGSLSRRARRALSVPQTAWRKVGRSALGFSMASANKAASRSCGDGFGIVGLFICFYMRNGRTESMELFFILFGKRLRMER